MADLSAFLPWSFNGLAAGLPGGGPRCRIQRGTVLFTDVAGFTPLTEALSVLGREGSEELTRILNAYFTRMIAIADQEGGDVLRFGGDSMTLLFPGEAPGRALRAASRMMEAMSGFSHVSTRAGTFSLSMKIGAAAGPVLLGIVGDEASGYDFYAAGPPLDAASAAEHQALPGEAVLDGTVAGPAPGGIRVRTQGGRRLLAGRPAAPPRRPRHEPPPPASILERVVPPVLHFFADQTVLGEHRGTAVLFVRFEGLPFQAVREGGGQGVRSLHDALEALHRLFSETARHHGGYLNKLDMGDKGAKALLLFGSPRALENKEEMAVRAALHLLHKARLPEGISLRMGLASAPLFAGPLGALHCREYTAMGNGINLAARLMQSAGPSQIRCDGPTVGAVPAIEFRPLPPVRLKGLKEPVAVFEPVGEREELLPERSERLVERQEIQRRLLRHLLRGEGRPLLLRGGPGLGKTALLEWALAAVQVKGRPCVRVPLGPHSVSKPYAAWRGPLRALLGVRREDPAEAVRNALGARFSGEGARYSSLLCPLLDLPEENSAAVGALGASERRDLTFALMRDLLKRDRGVSLLFDNVQWADPLSLDLLVLLLEGAPENPVRLAATLRPGFPEVEARLEGAQVLDLPPLSDKGLQKLLTEGQGFLPPEPEVTGWFAQRSRGNPAVAMALVTALDAAGCIQRGSWGARLDGDRLFRTRFPDTLEGLYLAPLDRLGAAEKRLLQQAAVLGVSISVNLLREVSGLPEEEAAALLSALEHARLLLPDTWGVRPYARFADALLRDAVYAATPFEVKRDIHARMARFLEQDGGSVPKMWPALAHHYRAAGDETSARRYARLAGRDAYARADPLTALEHLERVCRPPTADPEDVEDAFRLLDVYEGLGKWADAGPVLAELERLEGTLALPHRARLRNYLAIERPEEAEALLLEGVRLADEAGDVLLGAKARLNLVGRVYGPTGRMNEAKSHLHSVLAAPEVPGMVLLKGVSLMNLGNAHWFGGDPAAGERYLRQSAQVFRRAGLTHRESAVANNLAALYSESGKFPKVIWWARRSMASGRLYSGRGAYEASRTNLASALLAGGMAEQALRTTQHSLKESQSRNARTNMAHAQYRTAYAAFQLGDIHRVIESSLSAFDLFKNLNMGRFVLPSLNPVFRLYHQLGLRERARGFWEDSVQNLSHFRGSLEDAPSLEVIHFEAWISPSGCSQATPAMSADLPPNETSDGLCWQLEDAMASGDRARLEGALDHLEGHLPRWPHIEAKWAAALGRRLSAGRMSREERHRCERLLRRCAGGVHGLRLIAFLLQEKGLDARGRWERIASRRLAFVRQHSPPWAWEALLRFPEVRALAERPAWGRDRAEKGPAERRRARAARSKKAKGKSS